MVKIESHLINLSLVPMENTVRIPMDLNFTVAHNSRDEARAAGADRYFTGVPCQRDHLSDRYTSTGNCIECHNARIGKRQLMPITGVEDATIPVCLKGKANLVPCLKCELFHECRGKTCTSQLVRATLVFADHGPLTAATARANGLSMYKPENPCPVCNRLSWRTFTGKCGECETDKLNISYRMTEEQRAANWARVLANINDPWRIAEADRINKLGND